MEVRQLAAALENSPKFKAAACCRTPKAPIRARFCKKQAALSEIVAFPAS
jgi:hypothetical protein